jgi:carbon monoxide dehydrogenase subunit G
MDLEHTFTVPVDVDTAWSEFQDIASVAQCFPGATVTGVEDDTFTGSVKVKLGPIALTYNGSGTFTEKDEANHRFVVDAKGKDKRGNGTAGATVTLTMTGTGAATDVKVHTDLAITGKPAQFGRGVMQDVSDKLLGQFVACLEQRLGDSGTPAPAEPTTATEPAAPSAASAPAPPAPAPPAESEAGAQAAAPAEPVVPTTPVAPRPTAPSYGSAPSPGSDDALDLGKTVLPVLAKAYWKPVVAAIVVIIVLVWIFTR